MNSLLTDVQTIPFLDYTYSPWLVLLSFLVATTGSALTLYVIYTARQTRDPYYTSILTIIGALTFGLSLWAMHFIGMLAFSLSTPVTYRNDYTVLSAVPAIASAWIFLRFYLQPNLTTANLLTGGFLAGTGIIAMHFLGIMAIEAQAQLKLEQSLFVLSMVATVVYATFALWSRNWVKNWLASRNIPADTGCALLSGAAITSLHYLGMASIHFAGSPLTSTPQPASDWKDLAYLVTAGVLLATGAAVFSILYVKLKDTLSIVKRHGQRLEDKIAERNAELRVSNEELSIIFGKVNMGIAYVRNRMIVRPNEYMAQMFGYEKHELIQQSSRILYASEGFYDAVSEAYEVMRSGQPYQIELPMIKKDETVFMCNLVGNLVDPEDTDKGSIWTFRDTTEQRMAEQRLEESVREVNAKNERIADLLNNASQGFLSFGSDLIVSDLCSKLCHQLLGQDPSGLRIDHLLFPEREADAQLLRDCATDAFDVYDRRQQRMYLSLIPNEFSLGNRWLRAHFVPIDLQIMVVLSDITEERKLENRLAAEARDRELILAAVTDSDDFFSLLNEFRSFLQLQPQVLQNLGTQSLYRIIHTFKGSFNQFSFRKTPQALHEFESALQRVCTNTLPPEAMDTFLGTPWQACLEADLAVVRQSLGEDFLDKGGVLSLSREDALLFGTMAKRLLQQQAIQAADYPDLQKLANIQSVSLKAELMNFDRVIQQTATASGKEVAPLQLEGQDVRVNIETYRPLLQVLGHVFRNAVDHGIELPEIRFDSGKEETGKICCYIKPTENTVEIMITDDGKGIDEHTLREKADITYGQDFVQHATLLDLICADGLSSKECITAYSGRGVGMAAVREAVSKAGGWISLDSTPGQGTRLTFHLPTM